MENNNKIAVGLDIGTTKIVAIVGCKNEYGKLEILGVGNAKSLGVKKGVVSNIMQTVNSIKQAVEIAENESGEKVTDVVIGIAGQHIRSLQHTDHIIRDSVTEIIQEKDIDDLINQVHKLVMMPGEEIIHVLPQEFKVDGQTDITHPVGMFGGRIDANFHVVVGQTSSIKNVWECVRRAGLNLKNISLEPLASAAAVLSQEEKEAGVALVDIGGGTTDLAIFKDGIIRHTAVIPLGGNKITEDIKDGCSIIERQAELLKVKFGSAWPGENKETEIVSIPGLRGREPKEITLKNLSQIIHARVHEIIEQVFAEIKNYGHNNSEKGKLIAGIVLTGGGAKLKHLKQLVEYITGMDVRVGYPNEHLASGEVGKRVSTPEYATSVGLLLEGVSRQEKESFSNKNEQEEGKEEEIIPDSIDNSSNENPIEEGSKRKGNSFMDKFTKKITELLDNVD